MLRRPASAIRSERPDPSLKVARYSLRFCLLRRGALSDNPGARSAVEWNERSAAGLVICVARGAACPKTESGHEEGCVWGASSIPRPYLQLVFVLTRSSARCTMRHAAR